jgi:hypothetical protein
MQTTDSAAREKSRSAGPRTRITHRLPCSVRLRTHRLSLSLISVIVLCFLSGRQQMQGKKYSNVPLPSPHPRRLKIPWAALRPSNQPFHGVIPGCQAYPLGQIDLMVTFGTPEKFRRESLTFEVVDFASDNHAIFRRPCYVKLMAIPSYAYLKLKMPSPNGVITVGTSVNRALENERANCKLAELAVAKAELDQALGWVGSSSPGKESSRAGGSGSTEDPEAMLIDSRGPSKSTPRRSTSPPNRKTRSATSLESALDDPHKCALTKAAPHLRSSSTPSTTRKTSPREIGAQPGARIRRRHARKTGSGECTPTPPAPTKRTSQARFLNIKPMAFP